MQPSLTIFPFYIRVSMRLVLLCMLLICLFADVGHGTPRRVIAFVTTTDNNSRLHLMDVQSRIVRRISDLPVYSCCPSWSPDGNKIAFNGDNEQNYVVDIETGETRRLTPSKWSGWVMGWSADGQQVILRTLEASNGSLYRVDVDGNHFGLLAQGASNSIYLPQISPDGRFAFYAVRLPSSSDWKIFRLNLEDGIDHLFINENYRGTEVLALSPDGHRVAYALTERREVILMNADGSQLQRVKPTEDILEMAWSPNGQQLLFLAQDPAGVPTVYVTDADGRNQRDLGLKGAFAMMTDFSWSPDGAQIGFVGTNQIGGKPVLYVMDADGKNLQRLTSNSENSIYPAWQPGP